MPHVAIEAAILTPLLVMQILLFPFVANMMSSNWASATRDITLQETGSQMANTIQQLYVSLSRAGFLAGITIQASTFPREIAGHAYTAKGLLKTSSEQGSGKILHLNLTLQKLGNTAMVQTPLGPNVLWDENSLFESSSLEASIKVQKFANCTLLFSF